MRNRILSILICLTIAPVLLGAQDTTIVKSSKWINDYDLVGVNYGATMSGMYFNPTRYNTAMVTTANYMSVTYTKYCKMFDTFPYFAVVVGAAYGHEGFAFKADEETGSVQNLNGASWCSMDVIEIPAMGQMHMDFYPGKMMFNAGVYAGWRRSINRTGPAMDPTYEHSFMSFEHQMDYGFQGGVGFALMFDPVEIHFNCLVRWSWSNMYDPDYNSKYYYSYAYPLDIMGTVGIHFQLTKRSGKTTRQLRREAKDIVYNGKNADSSGKDR